MTTIGCHFLSVRLSYSRSPLGRSSHTHRAEASRSDDTVDVTQNKKPCIQKSIFSWNGLLRTAKSATKPYRLSAHSQWEMLSPELPTVSTQSLFSVLPPSSLRVTLPHPPATHRVLGKLWRHHTGRRTHSDSPSQFQTKMYFCRRVAAWAYSWYSTTQCDENGCCCHLPGSLICLWRCFRDTHELSRSELTTVLACSKLVHWTNLSAEWPTFL